MVLFILPWLDRSPVRSSKFRPIHKQLFWVFVADCILLGWVGANPAAPPYLYIGQAGTAYYFAHFFIILPLLSVLERPRALPNSISEAVLKGGGTAMGATTKPMEKA